MFICKVSGFTLLELMLAISLSAVISYDLIQVAVGLRTEIKRQQQKIHLFETLRFLSQVFSGADSEQCDNKQHFRVIGFDKQHITLMQCIHYHQHWQWLPVDYFVARDYRGHLALYQQPTDGERQSLSQAVVAMRVQAVTPKILTVWCLSRSADAIFSGESCYDFADHRQCQRDGYHYFAWPLHVG